MPYRLENIGNTDVQILITMAPPSLWKQSGEEASNGTSMPAQGDGRLAPTLH